MPVFASFVALSGRILRGNGTRPEWVDDVIGTGMVQGQAFSDSVSATAIPSVTYSVTSGSLPNGLTLNSSTGAITGTPSAGGNYNFTITASNAVGSASKSYTRAVGFPTPSTIDYLVVAGGGTVTTGGGGGAGGMRTGNISITGGTAYSITVGGSNGNSSGFGISCTRGGRGGHILGNRNGEAGGSGGGGNYYYPGGAGTSGQGRSGGGGSGNGPGGGGGKSANGRGGSTGSGSGGGGNGSTWLDGQLYAHGGNGRPGVGVNSPNRANSGNGANRNGSGAQKGAVGFRVLTDTAEPTISAGLTYNTTVSGDYTIYVFTNGTGTVTW